MNRWPEEKWNDLNRFKSGRSHNVIVWHFKTVVEIWICKCALQVLPGWCRKSTPFSSSHLSSKDTASLLFAIHTMASPLQCLLEKAFYCFKKEFRKNTAIEDILVKCLVSWRGIKLKSYVANINSRWILD